MTRDKKVPQIKDYDATIAYIKEELGIDKSFDQIHLELDYAGKRMSLFMIDGFVKDDIMHYLMKLLSKLDPEDLDPDPLTKLMRTHLPYMEIEEQADLEKAIDFSLGGPSLLIVEGVDTVIVIDARTYPVRGPSEPDLERVVRGSRDGFVETIVFNTSLTRRRVRDRTLRMEYMKIGRRSQTDICISYIEDIADEKIVEKIKDSLSKIDTDGLPMAEKTIEEFVCGQHWNPYPLVRYTERPDTAAVHLYEGHVLVFVDGSPSVLITPATFWHHLQHMEEYRQKPVVGAYLRFVRFFAVLLSIFSLPLWYLFSISPEMMPAQLAFIGPEEAGDIPLFVQLILIEIGLDIMRMATVHIPSSLATALGLVAAILIGQVAVEVGLFLNEVILYISIAAIGSFATPSYELSLANRLTRLMLLILTALFALPGYMIGTTLWIILLSRLKSFHIPYLWPFLPFSYKGLRDVLIRSPIPLKNRRPTVLHPKDPDR
ncbi:spore germination protein [Pseudalkalibacillus salsuginis]|uniref:spore germination protein n=1 Tax=Pseudalkalibacillus salsuginis TaxID=2910972 RepID=UPI001F1CBAC5|nr:spore germination protein [Pseudalkalibacillus salsuginis]MCF6408466.1 spore germination protein [Pseudalkalibacillus salsuginis]